MNWDGKGKHPVLKKTKAEIMAMNEAISERRAADHADNKEKKPQPSFQEEVTLQSGNAQDKQKLFIDNLADALTTSKS